MDYDLTTYSGRLNYALDTRGISQAELARRVGISQQAVQYLCNAGGSKNKRSKYTPEIARELNIDFAWLNSGEGAEPTQEISEQTGTYTAQKAINWELIDRIVGKLNERIALYNKRVSKEERKKIIKTTYDYFEDEEVVTDDKVVKLIDYKISA